VSRRWWSSSVVENGRVIVVGLAVGGAAAVMAGGHSSLFAGEASESVCVCVCLCVSLRTDSDEVAPLLSVARFVDDAKCMYVGLVSVCFLTFFNNFHRA
jgi:hypothetical protein